MTKLRRYNGLLVLELGLRITHLGQGSIIHILLMYKLIAKVQIIKTNQNSTKFTKIISSRHLDLIMSSLGVKALSHQQLCIHKTNYNNKYIKITGKQEKKYKTKIKKKKKREQIYHVRCCVHLNYHLLKTMLSEVGEASTTLPYFKTQAIYLDVVKAQRSLSNT